MIIERAPRLGCYLVTADDGSKRTVIVHACGYDRERVARVHFRMVGGSGAMLTATLAQWVARGPRLLAEIGRAA